MQDTTEVAEFAPQARHLTRMGGIVLERNVGLTDRYWRIAVGATILGCGVAHMVRRENWTGTVVSLLGGMFLADGILGTCPLYEPFDFSTRATVPVEDLGDFIADQM